LKKSSQARNQVTEITLDMAANMGLVAKKCFPNATRVTDRFHVQKLALEALQKSESNTVGKQ
jgi:transposase